MSRRRGDVLGASLGDDEICRSGTIIYFECEKLDETVAALKAQQIEFETEPRDERWLWRGARLRDPDGNRICLFYAGENRLNRPRRIKE